MGGKTRARCRSCGKHRNNVGSISWEGLCLPCGIQILEENILGLHLHNGDALKRWRRGVARSVGAVLLDDLPTTRQSGD